MLKDKKEFLKSISKEKISQKKSQCYAACKHANEVYGIEREK